MTKAQVSVGYTRRGLEAYKTWESPNVTGADVEARDGCGNIIVVSVREGDIGFRINLNGKTVLLGGLLKQDAELIAS